MSDDLVEQAKRRILGQYPNWVKRFEVAEYLQNQPMIEKLFEEKQMALALTIELEKKVEHHNDKIQELRLENQNLSLKLNEVRKLSFLIFSLSLIATILVGIGVNIATDNPQTWIGWVMIVSAALIEALVFVVTTQNRE